MTSMIVQSLLLLMTTFLSCGYLASGAPVKPKFMLPEKEELPREETLCKTMCAQSCPDTRAMSGCQRYCAKVCVTLDKGEALKADENYQPEEEFVFFV